METLLNPVILFFVLGVLAGGLRSDLRLPEALYDTLSIYLLVAIGLKGGVELAQTTDPGELVLPAIAAVLIGVTIPPVAYAILRRLGRFERPDAAAIAAHYGSVSVVTFAVAIAYLDRLAVPYEGFVTTLLVIMEVPGIAVGILIARLGARKGSLQIGPLMHELFLGKSIFLLVGGLVVGYVVGPARIGPVEPLFFDLFHGALAFFLLEMGIVTAHRLGDLRRVGTFLVAFGTIMPLFLGMAGAALGALAGLSLGGATILATLSASASYIAATAAMRVTVPEANPTLYLTASLGITFPFNIIIGIPIYFWMASLFL